MTPENRRKIEEQIKEADEFIRILDGAVGLCPKEFRTRALYIKKCAALLAVALMAKIELILKFIFDADIKEKKWRNSLKHIYQLAADRGFKDEFILHVRGESGRIGKMEQDYESLLTCRNHFIHRGDYPSTPASYDDIKGYYQSAYRFVDTLKKVAMANAAKNVE